MSLLIDMFDSRFERRKNQNSNQVTKNHQTLSQTLGFDLSSLVTCQQVHQDTIALVDESYLKKDCFLPYNSIPETDALVTDVPGILLMTKYADCVPLLFYDPKTHTVAIAHAGWKGTLSEITIKTIHQMKKQFGCSSADIKAGIGPAIGKCCFSVNSEVAEKFTGKLKRSEYFVKQNNSSSYIDLKEANKIQMILAGLNEENIETSDICTSCSSDVFFSHRREKGRTGRFALLAGLHRF